MHGRKFNPNPKFLGTAEAYFVCHIGPIFQISLLGVHSPWFHRIWMDASLKEDMHLDKVINFIEKLTLGFSLLFFLSVILASFFCIEVLIVVESYPKTAASGVWCTMFFIYMTYTLLALHLQGISYWSGHYKLALTDTYSPVMPEGEKLWGGGQ